MSNPFAYMSPEQRAQTWQARVLRETTGKFRHVLLRCMKNEYIGVTSTSWDTFLRGIGQHDRLGVRPTLLGHARVELSGRITTIVQQPDFSFQRVALYQNKDEFIKDARMVADALKLTDSERTEMFGVLKGWIPEDRTVGLHGERLAS